MLEDGWMLGFCWGTNIETPVQELHIRGQRQKKIPVFFQTNVFLCIFES